MKVLHLDSGREMRGGQWQVLYLHRGLIRAGHSSMLLAPERAPLIEHAKSESLPCDVLRPLRLGWLSRSFDLVHAHDARTHTLGALFARVPLVVSRRVAFPVNRSAASRWKYRKPQLFLAVSQYVALELMQAGVEMGRIAIVHDGVPVPPLPSLGKAVIVPETVDSLKGMKLAEEAAALAGVEIERSRDLASDLPRARALVYLTRSEGLGSGVLLGMAHGVTVIASAVGGIPEVIRDGENGILVSNEREAIAGAFRRINPALGLAARKTVLARFSDTRMVQGTLAQYKKVLERG